MEFGGSVLTMEKVKNQDLIFIAPEGKSIKAFEELCRPETKRDCQVFSGMLSSLQCWSPTIALEIPLIRKATASKGVSFGQMRCKESMKWLEKPC